MIYQYRKAINLQLLRNHGKRRLNNMFINGSDNKLELKTRDEDFSAPIWRNSVLFLFSVFTIYKIDEWYGLHHEGQGFFTRIIEYFKNKDNYTEIHIESLKKISELAKERLNQQDSKRIPIYRLKFPEQLNQGSSYNLIPGTEIDLSQYDIKTDIDNNNSSPQSS
ncbi:hypothetical protein T552_01275 [Pneumocystis carinii B80]|uniref:Uncharacterized protein n=1 Tax=Pneumocystis carinii (strain B80) TaxID=1408658 RepID=A0A0W4ZLR0_PNEC8|nr:hypothetical protein T552_01275 [Pneumocystis carinii B80]KTW29320.1 hypothetical protein T552_01275 [Pneumocystis carinii B80]